MHTPGVVLKALLCHTTDDRCMMIDAETICYLTQVYPYAACNCANQYRCTAMLLTAWCNRMSHCMNAAASHNTYLATLSRSVGQIAARL